MLKVVHIAPSSRSQSSAAWRIVRSQRQIGIEAIPLVFLDSKSGDSVSVYNSQFLGYMKFHQILKLNSTIRRIFYRQVSNNKLPWSVSVFSHNINHKLRKIKPDIIHLHWIPSTINLRRLAKLGIPVFLTLHDVWILTGGCHCNLECTEWRNGCKKCPQMTSRISRIMSPELQWSKQRDIFSTFEKLILVCPSKWIHGMAKISPKFVGRQIEYIPNCLDVQPQQFNSDKEVRSFKKFVFVFSDERNAYHKGLDILESALQILDKDVIASKLELNIVGGGKLGIHLRNIEVIHTPKVSSESEMLNTLFDSDLLVMPSRQDNLPNVAIEANIVGTPVIAINIGGVSDIVEHNRTGYLVNSFDPQLYAKALKDFLDGHLIFESNSVIAELTNAKFNGKLIAQRYLATYMRTME